MHQPSLQRFDCRRLSRRMLLACVLALGTVLLLAQGIELGHSHDDLQSQLDCQICLKHSPKGKLLASSSFDFALATSGNPFLEFSSSQISRPTPPARSRAPPQPFTQ